MGKYVIEINVNFVFNFNIQRKDWETEQFYENKWKYVPLTGQYTEPEKAMEFVRKGGFAYHTHPEVGYQFINRYFTNREICELTEIHLLRPTSNCFAVNPNNTFIEILKVG